MRKTNANIAHNKADIVDTVRTKKMTNFNGQIFKRWLTRKEIINNTKAGIHPQKKRRMGPNNIFFKALSDIVTNLSISHTHQGSVEIASAANERIKEKNKSVCRSYKYLPTKGLFVRRG